MAYNPNPPCDSRKTPKNMKQINYGYFLIRQKSKFDEIYDSEFIFRTEKEERKQEMKE